MRHYMKITIMTLVSTCFMHSTLYSAPPEVIKKARRHGAKGKVTFRVVDNEGLPVSNANVNAAFSTSDSRYGVDILEGQTGTNGIFIAEGKSVGDLNYTITKDSYYKSYGRYWFYRSGKECLQEGRWLAKPRWQPWNPTNTVVLKKCRNPIPMYAKRVDTTIPIKDQPIGFDFEIGDWMAPHGKGKQSDLFFTYNAKIQDHWTFSNQLVVACSNKMNGMYRTSKDMWSDFHSTYEAASDGYQGQIVLSLDRTQLKILKREELGDGEYLVFRVRTVVDDKGKLISARYGKIYGPIVYGGGKDRLATLRFIYYFNATPNDPNLEFDPSQNLFHWRSRDRERVSVP